MQNLAKIYNKLAFLIKKVFSLSTSFITEIEDSQMSFNAWFFSIISFAFLRNFLEIFSARTDLTLIDTWPFFFLHSISFYLCTFLIFISIIHFITSEKIEKVSKASIFMAPLILLTPLIDLFIFRGQNATIQYIEIGINSKSEILGKLLDFIFFGPNGLLQFLEIFTNFGNAWQFDAIWRGSYGVKIEVGMIVIFAAIYVFLKTSSVIKTLIFLFFSRIAMFLLVYFPYLGSLVFRQPANECGFMGDFSKFNKDFSWHFVVFTLYLIIIIILSAVWFWRYDKIKFLALAKNIRIERLCLYVGAFFYGIYLSSPDFKFSFSDLMVIVLAVLAIIFSWLFAIGSNDLADEKGDGISKPYRPLPSGEMSHSEVKNLNIIFRVVSYICAFAAGYAFFITILIRSCISYLYSNSPFRLKKFPIISTFCIASGVLLGILGGFLLFFKKDIADFPVRVIFFILTFFTLGMNFIHINDREGDKKEKIWTIPVIFGEKIGKLITAICLAIAFLSVPFFYPEIPAIVKMSFIILAAIGFLAVNRKNFKEWQIIVICAIVAILVILFTERPLWILL